jgi:hypothetical protein
MLTQEQIDKANEYIKLGPNSAEELAAILAPATLIKAAIELVRALDKCEKSINDAFVFAAIHGQNYSALPYNDELEVLRASLRIYPALSVKNVNMSAD